MAKKIFVTATDTGAGKTFVTSRLVKSLLEQGAKALAIKPVASGIASNGLNEDVDILLKVQKLSDTNQINLHSFKLSAAPNIAAAAENTAIDLGQLVTWCNEQAKKSELCLIEGVGGLMAPLNQQYLVSDWLGDMQANSEGCEVMLVIGARLGCINHALLTLQQLERLNMPPKYIVINAVDGSDIAEQAKTSLQPFIPAATILTMLPYQASTTHFKELASRLLNDV
jgi:dethiobiotin synthetase